VDAVTHALLARHRPGALAGLETIGRTPAAPGLPLVTAAERGDREVTLIREALAEVAGESALAPARRALLLDGFAVLEPGDYDAILRMEEDCVDRGYPALA
jgi:hypothetical protein